MTREWDRIEPPYWDDGRPTIIVGNGKSVAGFDFERVRGKYHVLAVKGAMFNLPFADAGFGLDSPRLNEWRGMLNTINTFPVYWAVPDIKLTDGVEWAPCMRFIRRIDTSTLSDDPTAIMSGGTSGYGALNLAYLKRARRIVVMGYDYDADQNGIHDSRAYIETREQDEQRWRAWAKNFDKIKRQLDVTNTRVINASPNSRVPTFEKMEIGRALDEVLR